MQQRCETALASYLPTRHLAGRSLPTHGLPHQDGESRKAPFHTAQQVNLSACSPHCPLNAEHQAGEL